MNCISFLVFSILLHVKRRSFWQRSLFGRFAAVVSRSPQIGRFYPLTITITIEPPHWLQAIAAYIIVCLKEEYDFRDHQQYSKLRDQALRERLARKSQKLAAVEAGDPGPSPTAEVPATEQEGKSLPK